jgi:ketosteroid isomerase-like protein
LPAILPDSPSSALRRAGSMLAGLAVTALLAGCGGAAEPEATASTPKPKSSQASEDEAAVKAVVSDFMTAFAAGDGDAACTLMTDQAIADVVDDGQERSAEEAFQLCADTVGTLGEFLEGEEREQAENPEFTSVSVDGDTAQVGVTFDDATLTLERADDGSWLLAEGPGAE